MPRYRLAYGSHRSQHAELWLPDTPPTQPACGYPVAVLIHGGYWKAVYTKRMMAPLAGDLIARNWAVWNVEYRRVGPFLGGGWPGTLEDVAAAMDHVARLAGPHQLDLDRVVTIGHSAGGHLALWSAARPRLPRSAPGRPGHAAVIPTAAIGLGALSDLEEAARLGLGGGAAVRFLGGPPRQHPERYAAASPAALLPLSVPQVLIHGTQDRSVPIGLSEQYVRRAVAAGDDAELVALAGVGHMEPLDPASSAWAATVAHLGALLG